MKQLFFMRNLIILVTLLTALPLVGFSQSKKKKTFVGMLEYKITARDSVFREFIPDNHMIVYTNDTIVRIENFTHNLGNQIAIKHMILDKSYLLLETGFGKFAIQMDESEAQKEQQARDTTAYESDEYLYEKKCGKQRMLGYKMNRVLVTHPEFGDGEDEETIEFLYLKGYSTRIVDAYPEIDGIPTKYSVITPDAVLDYTLVKISEYTPNNDLFGVPSDFERISFNDFMDKLIEANGAQEEK